MRLGKLEEQHESVTVGGDGLWAERPLLGHPSSTVQGKKQRFLTGSPRSHAGFRRISQKAV
jgi:hypothetical protein